MKTSLLGMHLDELNNLVNNLNGNTIHVQTIATSIYKKNIANLDEIENIPTSLIKSLGNKYNIGKYSPKEIIRSNDGSKKYLFVNEQGQQFESVFMPNRKRSTLCISTQSGCRMGCKFCLTGKIGFNGSLSALDILNQLYSIDEYKKVNKIVIMGMGEPFDNYVEVKKAVTILTSNWGGSFGASNITLSTVGLIEPLKDFLKYPFCNLAISLSNPIDIERAKIMPIEKSNPIAEAIDIIKKNPLKKPLRISFEYVALKGINLSEKHAKTLADLLNGIRCHINIISWNVHDGSQFESPDDLELNNFINCLNKLGVLASVRKSRGQDIGAACGQMAGKGNKQIRIQEKNI